MRNDEMLELLDRLLQQGEGPLVEFKEANGKFKNDELGKYISGLSNAANLYEAPVAWLVFGVNDKSQVVGTNYKDTPKQMQTLPAEIANKLEPFSVFNLPYEVLHENGRALLFKIAPAPQGQPVKWGDACYKRSGESLKLLSPEEIYDFYNQGRAYDWSAELVETASMDDLDKAALHEGRERYRRKNQGGQSVKQISDLDDLDFLKRIRLVRKDRLTRAALILLGKDRQAEELLQPFKAEIFWKHTDKADKVYKSFGPPFILSVSHLYNALDNREIEIFPENWLLPTKIKKYDSSTVFEALNNCIAHQDYLSASRITVTEFEDKLEFRNAGSFFEGNPDDYYTKGQIPEKYRNELLAKVMSDLGMIDRAGFGIQRMFKDQADKFFPLPDYDLEIGNKVKLTIHGRIIDSAYTELLAQKTNLNPVQILGLDRVQKKLPISDDLAKQLKQQRLIEGRKPNYFVSALVAKATGKKAEYIHARGQEQEHYEKLVMGFLESYGSASREDIDKLLWDKLSDSLNDEQKKNKIGNLISSLRMNGRIRNEGSRTAPKWILT